MQSITYYITTFPGIEPIARDEMGKKLAIKVDNTLRAKNNSLLRFDYAGKAKDLLSIKTAEDVFVILGSAKLGKGEEDLKVLKSVIFHTHKLDAALFLHRQVKIGKKRSRTTYRVVAQATGKQKEYRRVDAQNAVEQGIYERFNGKWGLVEDNADLEVWLHLVHDEAVLGLRLSDRTMRHRDYKIEHIPASLRPTIAYAMVWLSKIRDDDIFLDPMCGAATILIERAQAGRYKKLLGGDVMPEAIRVAKNNIGEKYKPIEINIWDAGKLPLGDDSVTKVVCNPPFGKQIGTTEELRFLYEHFLKEVQRVLSPGGRGVFLISMRDLFRAALVKCPSLKLAEHYKKIWILGHKADIYVIEKK